MLCSRASISSYAAWFSEGVSTGGVPCYYGPGLDGNDPLLSLRLYSFMCGFGVALGDERSHMGGSADMKSLVCIGGVCVGCCGTHIVSGCIHSIVHWGLFHCCS